jgi:hypothetical protein
VTVDGRLASVARAVNRRRVEISGDLRERVADAVPELRGDLPILDLLLSAVEGNVTNLLHILEHGIDPDTVEAPPASLEHARTLAERGIPVSAQLRAYRLGHGRFLTICTDEVTRQALDAADLAAVTQQLIDVSFRYIDRASERVIAAYQEASERWALLRSAARSGRVRQLLDNHRPDVDAAEAAIGYRMRRLHVGLVCWVPETPYGGEGLARLDRLTTAIARRLRCIAQPLFVPFDHSMAWSWLPIEDPADVAWDVVRDVVAGEDPTARVAAGEPALGVEGFQQTHQEAGRARDVAHLARPGERLTTFADVGPVALLLPDVRAARGWVWQVLGSLAGSEEQDAMLRETLRVFLSTGGSYTSTARLLSLHRNTVQYRVRKAQNALGYPIASRREDVELALRVCRNLGSPVLRDASATGLR